MKLFFTSWNDEVVDNRGNAAEKWNDASSVNLPLDFDAEHSIAAFMGWGGIILTKDSVNMVEMCSKYIERVKAESCGKCYPCRVGTAVLDEILKKIMAGKGVEADLIQLEGMAKYISASSKCYIGKTGPIPLKHALTYFRADFMAYVSRGQVGKTDYRYEAKWTAPCYSACPAGMNIPSYIELIKENRYSEAIREIREASPMAASLGRACFHPCESNCRRINVETAISICKLKRFAWDYEDQHFAAKPINKSKNKQKEKVAILGCGPAGLSAAYYLALKGYPVTIFEALPVPGGMVGVGIPEYRVPKEVLQREADFIESMGVEIKYNTPIGNDLTISQLKEQGYKAFFISTGAHISNKMGIEGEDAGYSGFIRGIDYLKDCVLTKSYDVKGKRVVVVGGGNVAMDCCRSPIRLGAEEVTVVYRRTKKELPADPHEVYDSEIEGVKYKFLTAPKRIIEENGKVIGLECFQMELGEPDASGRRRPVIIEGSEFIVPADIILQAIGQECNLEVLNGVDGIKTTRWKTIEANADTFQTEVPWIFTGGDVYNGPLTIVDACGNARRAAKSIDQYLSGETVALSVDEKMDKVFKKIGVFKKNDTVSAIPGLKRVPMPMIPMEERISSFEEVETGYGINQAIEEASRCMRCYQVGMVALEKKE